MRFTHEPATPYIKNGCREATDIINYAESLFTCIVYYKLALSQGQLIFCQILNNKGITKGNSFMITYASTIKYQYIVLSFPTFILQRRHIDRRSFTAFLQIYTL